MMIYLIFMRLLLDIICSKYEKHFFGVSSSGVEIQSKMDQRTVIDPSL